MASPLQPPLVSARTSGSFSYSTCWRAPFLAGLPAPAPATNAPGDAKAHQHAEILAEDFDPAFRSHEPPIAKIPLHLAGDPDRNEQGGQPDEKCSPHHWAIGWRGGADHQQ